MELNELISQKREKEAELVNLRTVGETELRELTVEENTSFEELKNEIRNLDSLIEAKNNKPKINNRENKMDEFSKWIVRDNDKINNFKVRGVQLSTSIDNVQVLGGISDVGLKSFYKNLPIEVLPNLTTSVKLPYVNGLIASKVAEGSRYDNDKTIATVLLQPTRFTITETFSRELLAVADDMTIQAYISKLAVAVDRKITKEIFDVALASATAVTGLTGYTTASMDSLVSQVDGDVTLLMPRAEFYKAKAVLIGTAGSLFVANKTSQFAGELWDGTPLFFSNLYTGSTVVAADLSHVTLGEFGNEYEIQLDYTSKFAEGQVVVTVAKEAGVVVRNSAAVRKATIA